MQEVPSAGVFAPSRYWRKGMVPYVHQQFCKRSRVHRDSGDRLGLCGGGLEFMGDAELTELKGAIQKGMYATSMGRGVDAAICGMAAP